LVSGSGFDWALGLACLSEWGLDSALPLEWACPSGSGFDSGLGSACLSESGLSSVRALESVYQLELGWTWELRFRSESGLALVKKLA